MHDARLGFVDHLDTLRDGAQTQGVDFGVADKAAVARESLNWLDLFQEAASRLDHDEVERILESGDAMAAQAMVRSALWPGR